MNLIERQEKIIEKLEKIDVFIFTITLSLNVPLKIIDLSETYYISEEVDYYNDILKDTDYSDNFVKINANEIDDYIEVQKDAQNIRKFRTILENENSTLTDKIKKLNKWKFWNKKLYKDFISRESRYNEVELKKRKLTFGDFLIYNEFTNLGLPFALEIYSLNFKTKQDFITKDINVILNLDGMGPKRKEKLLSFIEKVKSTDNFDNMLFKLSSTY